eukprot:TRINITY_DN3103_c0_g2_i1.p1 TRINITY_DN3103_c0_g2~~TRINITY_DN3103_c0_g2_i1.p1  ORF type:complete len:324 (+),score=48.52 TRINITY_DN3103_c0_g2_i1:28-999(+)
MTLDINKIAHSVWGEGCVVEKWKTLKDDSPGGGNIIRLDIQVRPDDATQHFIIRQHGTRDRENNPGIAQDEYHLLQVLEASPIAAPKAIHVDSSCSHSSTPFLIVSYIAGDPDFSLSGAVDRAAQMAKQLAAIHTCNLRMDSLSFLKVRETPQLNGHPPDLHKTVIDALEANWPPLDRNPNVLLHGDFWPGNVVWQDGKLSGVIDWEDVALGDPMQDFAIARMDQAFIMGWDAMLMFSKVYRDVVGDKFDFTDSWLWDLFAVRRLARMLPSVTEGWDEEGRPDINVETVTACLSRFSEEALKRQPQPPLGKPGGGGAGAAPRT